VVQNGKLREKYRKLMMLGFDWVEDLMEKYGNLSGYELHAFI